MRLIGQLCMGSSHSRFLHTSEYPAGALCGPSTAVSSPWMPALLVRRSIGWSACSTERRVPIRGLGPAAENAELWIDAQRPGRPLVKTGCCVVSELWEQAEMQRRKRERASALTPSLANLSWSSTILRTLYLLFHCKGGLDFRYFSFVNTLRARLAL